MTVVDVVLIGEPSPLLHDTALGVQRSGLTVLVIPPGEDDTVRDLRPQLIVDTTEPSGNGIVVFERSELEIDTPVVSSGSPNALASAIIDMIGTVRYPTPRGRSITAGDITLDLAGITCIVGGQVVDLTPTEFRLLRYLVENAGIVVSKDQILENVFDFDGYQPNVVEVNISSLRRKIDVDATRRIETVRGIGYVIRLAEQATTYRQPTAS